MNTGAALAHFALAAACASVCGAPVELPALHTEGTRIVNASGETVVLTGTNLGGWLLQELWLTQWQPESMVDDWGVRATLARRFSPDRVDELIARFQDVYVTEDDIARLAGLGINHLRVPFGSALLEDEDAPGVPREEGWRRLDWIVEQCRRHGLHCMLDMHGAPGGQSHDHTTGRAGRNNLWFGDPLNDRAAAYHQEQMVRLWSEIASRYRDEAHVLLDIVNEPVGAPDEQALLDLHEQVYRAIRATGFDHIVVMELFAWESRRFDAFVPPAERGWSNVVFEVHPYLWDAFGGPAQRAHVDRTVRTWATRRAALAAPIYFGEWQAHTDAACDYAMQEYNRYGFSWAHWNFRVWWDRSTWGIDYRSGGLDQIPDFEHDSFESLRSKIAACARANYSDNPGLVTAFLRHGDATEDRTFSHQQEGR